PAVDPRAQYPVGLVEGVELHVLLDAVPAILLEHSGGAEVPPQRIAILGLAVCVVQVGADGAEVLEVRFAGEGLEELAACGPTVRAVGRASAPAAAVVRTRQAWQLSAGDIRVPALAKAKV